MANDAIGITKIYADSKTNPQNVFVPTAQLSNSVRVINLTGIHALNTIQIGGGTGGGVSGYNPLPGAGGGSGGSGGGGGVQAEGSGSVDKFGVRATYATGAIMYNFRENFRDDGKRFDFSINSSAYSQAELIGYFACGNPPDDECSGKMGGGKHSDSNRVNVWDMGVDLRNGDCRYRTEDIHPNYNGGQEGGKGKAMTSSYLGYKFIKRNMPGHVLLEIWQDQGNNEGAQPANQWVRCASYTPSSPQWRTAPNDHQETIRIDGPGGVSCLKWKWLSLREIKDGDPTSPNQGGGSTGGGTTTPPAGGGGSVGSVSISEIGFTGGNQNGKIVIYNSSGYSSGKINRNHSQNATNGFMQDAKDWKNVEATGYIKVTRALSNDQFSIKIRGGALNGCEGCGIGVELGYDGNYRPFKVRRYADEYSYGGWNSGIGDIQNRWIGYKLIVYNVQGGVKYEFYLDTNNSNSWRKVFETIDNGSSQLSGGQSACGGNAGQPITWGGPLIFVEWQNIGDPDGILLRQLSFREIDPTRLGSSDVDSGIGGGSGVPSNTIPPYVPGSPYVPGTTFDPITGTIPGFPGSVGGGGSSGDGTGGIGTGIPQGNPQEQQIAYEQFAFMIRYNINYWSTDACGLGKGAENLPLIKMYDVAGDVFVDGKNYSRCGIYVAFDDPVDETKKSMFIDRILRDWKVRAKKFGNNSLTGNISAVIRDKNYNIVATIGTFPVGSLSGNEAEMHFPFLNNTYKLKKGDHISIEYPNNTQDDYVRIKVSQVDKIDGTNTMLFSFDGANYIYDPFADMGGIVSI